MNLSSITTIPKCGPATYAPQFLNGTPIAAGASSPLIDFRFPRSVFVTAILLIPGSGDPADAARLELRIQDETQRDMFTDGQGSGFFIPSLVMHGFSWKPYDFQRPVCDGDHWFFTVRNTFPGAGPTHPITPFVTIFFEEPFLKERGGLR